MCSLPVTQASAAEAAPTLGSKQRVSTSPARRGHPLQLLLTGSEARAAAASFVQGSLPREMHRCYLEMMLVWRWPSQNAARFSSEKLIRGILMRCGRETSAYWPPSKVWNVPSGPTALFQGVIIVKPHCAFFFILRGSASGKEDKATKIYKCIISWNGQFLTSIKGKIKLFRVFSWTFTKKSKGKINYPDRSSYLHLQVFTEDFFLFT